VAPSTLPVLVGRVGIGTAALATAGLLLVVAAVLRRLRRSEPALGLVGRIDGEVRSAPLAAVA
jgi:hypothetical protein